MFFSLVFGELKAPVCVRSRRTYVRNMHTSATFGLSTGLRRGKIKADKASDTFMIFRRDFYEL
jgi:hypothetical protein